jgi:DNA polymerase III subunit beta
MKITAPANVLRDTLAAPRSVCSPNTHQLAHTGVLLVAGDGRLRITGTDGDVVVVSSAMVEIESPGEALVPPRPLSALLDGLGTSPVSLEVSDANLVVRARGAAPYRLRLIASTFPPPLRAGTEMVRAELSGLERAVAAVRAAAGPSPSGVQLLSDAQGLRLAATDGYRLHTATLDGGGFGEFSGIVSAQVLEQVARAKGTKVAVEGNIISFEGERVEVSARLLATPFPEITPVLAAVADEIRVTVPAGAVRTALTRLGALGSAAPVQVSIDGTSMMLSAVDVEVGDGSEEIELPNGVADTVSFAADRGFFADAVGSHGDGDVELAWRAALAPVRLSSSHTWGRVVNVVMPVKI